MRMPADDAAKLQFLLDCGTQGAAHSGESLLDHLLATRDLLRQWGAPEFVCDAGLFHSIYGSSSYRPELGVRREDVQRLLGRDAERLVHLYSRCGGRLLELLSGGEAPADGVESAVDEDDLRWMAHLVVANELEQAGRGWPAELATDPRIERWLLPAAKAQIRPALHAVRSAFAKAGRVLTWAESMELVDEVALSYRSTAAEYLDAEIARLADERPDVFSAWQALPPALKEQLVTAPATCLRVAEADIDGSAWLRELLIQSVTALSLKLDPSAESSSPLWTPDGGFYFPTRRKGTEPTPPARFDAARPYQAVRFGRVTIDLFSPFAGDHLDGIPATDGTHSAEEAETVLQRVELALHLLYETSWQAATFVDLSLVSLTLQRDASTPTGVWSGSWPTMIGKAVLVNQHLDSWTPAAMADSILHEAIHSFLYRLERMVPIFFEPPPRMLTVRSPWTGADLAPSSFSHACLVWFGLWCFWRRARLQAFAPADDVQRLLTRAACGFLGPPLGQDGLRSYWTSGFATLVEWCQRQVESG
jgi:hypothetical protein